MVSRRTRVARWMRRKDQPSCPSANICCFFSLFETFAMPRKATLPPTAVNVLDRSLHGRSWVITEASETRGCCPPANQDGRSRRRISELRAESQFQVPGIRVLDFRELKGETFQVD